MSFKSVLAASAALLLAGCISFGEDPPESLLTLTPTSVAPAGSGATSNAGTAIALVEFEVPAALDVTRVPVHVSETEIAYLQDAVWVERPARLFRRLLGETLRARSNRVVVDGDDPGVMAEDRLQGVIRQFGYDVPSGSVVMVFDAIRNRPGSTVETRRFEARVPGIAPDVVSVRPALNQAANEVAGQVADWVR